jgi:ribonuclease P protein subunit RPR2
MTFEGFEIEVEEAASAAAAERRIAARRPDVIVLDVRMPGKSGLELCRELKQDPATRDIGVVLLSGSEGASQDAAETAEADAFIPKPFSPLEVLAVVDRLAGGGYGAPLRARRPAREGQGEQDQLIFYARDLRHMLEIERAQRVLLQRAYRETVAALASALETKDSGTRRHSQRVQRYALTLARAVDPRLAAQDGVEYGFLLHDVGKIGIPDKVLLKPAALTKAERRLMEKHTVLGEQMLDDVNFLQGEGLKIVRHHHERWDGRGYPDRIGGEEIPLGARVFAVADTLDAITSHRPYRRAKSWAAAREEIVGEAGKQFDPQVVEAFLEREGELRAVRRELTAVA